MSQISQFQHTDTKPLKCEHYPRNIHKRFTEKNKKSAIFYITINEALF